MSPTTLRAALQTPAMSFDEPFGLPSWAYRRTTWSPATSSSSSSGGA
jgi:hypothetical protein